MRARGIKPGFFKNEYLAELGPMTRLLFAGLWCMADREGRMEDRPKRIKAEIFPYDECDVDAMLEALSVRGFIERYEAGRKRYIAVLAFSKHQNPHKNERPSSIPAPYLHSTSTVLVSDEDGSAPADSLFIDSLTPDSLTPDPPIAPQGAELGLLGEERFEHWKQVFPRETAQLTYTIDTRRAVEARLREGIPPGVIDQAVTNAKRAPWWNGVQDGIWKAHLKKICGKGSTVETLAADGNGCSHDDECPAITEESSRALMEMNP